MHRLYTSYPWRGAHINPGRAAAHALGQKLGGRSPSGGSQRRPSPDMADIPCHSLINYWRLLWVHAQGMHQPYIDLRPLMGRGIPTPRADRRACARPSFPS